MSDDLAIVLVVAVVFLVFRLIAMSTKNGTLEKHVTDLAQQQFNAWKQAELESVKREAMHVASGQAEVSLQLWKQASEESIRADARERSRAVTTGKVLEHIAPHLPEFPYDPKDARFLGSPVDYVVFDGLEDGAVRKIVLVEIKTSESALTPREKQVKAAIESGRVQWREHRISTAGTADATASARRIATGTVAEAIGGPIRRRIFVSPASRGTQVVLPPLPCESNKAVIVRWLATPRTWVHMGSPLVEVATDDADVQLSAAVSGRLAIFAGQGASVSVGSVLGELVPNQFP